MELSTYPRKTVDNSMDVFYKKKQSPRRKRLWCVWSCGFPPFFVVAQSNNVDYWPTFSDLLATFNYHLRSWRKKHSIAVSAIIIEQNSDFFDDFTAGGENLFIASFAIIICLIPKMRSFIKIPWKALSVIIIVMTDVNFMFMIILAFARKIIQSPISLS